MRCWVKSRNERNPCLQLLAFIGSTLQGLPWLTRRKVGMTSSHHAPYVQGYTRATMADTEGCKAVRWSKSQKVGPSSDCRLQSACMKLESVVIADQPRRGEYVLGPCTHRPSRQLSQGRLKIFYPTRKGRRISKANLARRAKS